MSDEGKTIHEVLAESEGDDALPPDISTDVEPTPMDEVRDELGIGDGVDPVAALLDAPEEAPKDRVFIKRLKAWFVVEAIQDDKAYDRIVDRCTSYVKNRRGSGRTREVDGRRLTRLTVAHYTISPAFHPDRGRAEFDKLATKYGTKEPEVLVDRALLMGEVDALSDMIMTISGFEDELETAGN